MTLPSDWLVAVPRLQPAPCGGASASSRAGEDRNTRSPPQGLPISRICYASAFALRALNSCSEIAPEFSSSWALAIWAVGSSPLPATWRM